MGKILFIDVDGTLTDYEGKVPQSAIDAIRRARARGHRVYICTGRSRAEIYPDIWAIGLDGMIGGNGSYVEDHGQVIFHRCISPEQCRRAVDWLHARGLEFYLESNNGLFASEAFATKGLQTMREYSRRKDQPVSENFTIKDAFPDMIFGADLYRDDLNKISYVLSSYQDFLDTRAQFPDMENGTWGGAGETALFGDLALKGITKGGAITALLEHLKAPRTDTIAFGDAKIDIPMFECCAYSVAMANGGPEVKAAADFITNDVNDDGLWNAFQTLGLLDE